MGFGEGDTCEYCAGPIVEKRVTMHSKVKGNNVLIESVPAGVCTQCGYTLLCSQCTQDN